ncbi:MAG: HIT family protein [Bacilli bacterium]|nr:HIT family protein [Bacilli bacterium]
MNLENLTEEEIIKLFKKKEITVADIVDNGICSTCFDNENNHVLFGDNKDRMLYEDDDFECFLVGNPRANGHVAISTKIHYKDMMEIDDEICQKIFLLAKNVMKIIKEVYASESVYLCTMCDGPMNHFHVQLIPRYSFEKRGSKNFVKPRFDYIEDETKKALVRQEISKIYSNK